MRPFDGCWERIWRARAHSDAIAQMWNDVADDDRYSISLHVDDDGTGGIWVEPQLTPFPPEFSLELGELLYQLRAALDACIYQAAILETGQDPPPDEEALEFPICESPAKFKAAAWHIKPITDEGRLDIIESVQPYGAPDLPPDLVVYNLNRALAILHDWARQDRHRALHVMASWAANKNPQVRIPPGTRIAFFGVTGEGFLEHESQVASFVIDGWKPGMKIEANPNLSIDIAVNEPPPPCADTDTLSNRVGAMGIAVQTIVSEFEKSFDLTPHNPVF